ncbi:MAG: HNH endonuclease family protein, partial [Bryobacteraceae bacterium]
MMEAMGRRDITRFLRHLWVSKYGDLKNQDLFTALKSHIEANAINSLDFVRSCVAECENYVHLLDGDAEHLGKAAYPIQILIKELDSQSALPLLLSSCSVMEAGDLNRLAKWVLVFVTRYSVIANFDSSGLETILFDLAKEVRSRMVDPTASKACMAYVKDVLVRNAPSDERIKVAVPELILSPDEARYIVSRIATRKQTKTKEIKIDEANLEHIFPKRPSKEWNDVDDLEPFLWHVGNLIILGERLNNEAASRGYPNKRALYKSSELEIDQELARDYPKWDEQSIKDRAKKLAPLVNEIWNFNNTSRV